MYYEEQVIDNVLHFRSQPNGEWHRMTAEYLTELLSAARHRLSTVERSLQDANRDAERYRKIRDALNIPDHSDD